MDTTVLETANKLDVFIARHPIFDKSLDDRVAEDRWQEISGGCDIVLFEGWCVGACAQNEQALSQPVNDLERHQDAEGDWRNFVNRQLGEVNQQWFSMINIL